jgi:hypothetical protein
MVSDPPDPAPVEERSPSEEDPPSVPQPSGWPQINLDLKDVLGVLSVVGLVIYGSVRFADTAFYARLGTSPDDVGISYATTLSRVAGPVVLLAALVIALFFAVQLEKEHSTGLRVLCLLVLGLAAVVTLGELIPATPRFRLVDINIVPVVVTIVVVAVSAKWPPANSRRLRTALRPGTPQFWVVLGMTTVILFGLAGVTGYREAGYLRDSVPVVGISPLPCGCDAIFNHDVSLPWVSGTQGFYGVEATPVLVEWVGSEPPPRDLPPRSRPCPPRVEEYNVNPVCAGAYELGESDGVVILFDPVTNTSVAVPTSSVILSTSSQLRPFHEN